MNQQRPISDSRMSGKLDGRAHHATHAWMYACANQPLAQQTDQYLPPPIPNAHELENDKNEKKNATAAGRIIFFNLL